MVHCAVVVEAGQFGADGGRGGYAIYTWLTYRMSYLRRRTEIPWGLLRVQFGSDRANDRQGRWRFRKDFEAHLARVLVVYRDARVETDERGIVLRPSPPHVTARRA